MSIIGIFQGAGRRRKSNENWNELQRKASDAQEIAKKVQGAVHHTCPAHIHKAFWVYAENMPCPWCTIDRLRGQIELLTTRPAPRPGGIAVQAPADGAAIAIPATEPTVDVNADTQAVDVSDLRDALGESDTAVIPVVAVPPVALDKLPPVTWGAKTGDPKALEEWATAPGALPGAGAADIPNSAGLQAVTRVLATVPSTN